MAISREAYHLRRDPMQLAARTRDALGRRDAADPSNASAVPGDTPGPLGVGDAAAPAARRPSNAKKMGALRETSTGNTVPAWLPLLTTWVPAIRSLIEVLGSFGSGGTAPSWIEIAADETGVKEKAGKNSHDARIIQYHAATSLAAKDDETPWCSSFVNWVMKEAGYAGTGSALALSWRTWGDGLEQPALGSIGVIDWGKQDAAKKGTGHVGFVVGKTAKGHLVLLGGNQSHSVSRLSFARPLFVSFRVPKGFTVSRSLYDLPELKFEAGGFRESR